MLLPPSLSSPYQHLAAEPEQTLIIIMITGTIMIIINMMMVIIMIMMIIIIIVMMNLNGCSRAQCKFLQRSSHLKLLKRRSTE